eukprot:TRINITY_DN103531_c0_g1_i1.p1 TRINITY_DN103531_c0_g1~~TRINITY_DN103531_c0_g1_i1.p1  ORF type:complete len:362 (+),score=89.06 TRINITY_DN103531_c0_g1_i1:49-1086(+)
MPPRKRAPKAKRRKAAQAPPAQDPEDDDEDSDDDDEEEEAPASGKNSDIFEVDFDFFDPDEEDFHSVRDMLCRGTLGFSEIDYSGLADSIVGQVNIGSMIKSGSGEGIDNDKEDDSALCGMLTTLNLGQFKDKAWCQALAKMLVEKVKKIGNAEVEAQLQSYLQPKAATKGEQSTQIGLLIKERYENLPSPLLPPLYKAFLEDIEWSCNTPYCPPEERPFYGFTHFLGIARCHAAPASSKRAPVQAQGGPGLVFLRPEDEVLARAAAFCFSFPLPAPKETDRAADTEAASSASGAKKKKRKASAAVQDKGPQERRAVFGLTRKAFEKVTANLEKSLAAIEAEDEA